MRIDILCSIGANIIQKQSTHVQVFFRFSLKYMANVIILVYDIMDDIRVFTL